MSTHNDRTSEDTASAPSRGHLAPQAGPRHPQVRRMLAARKGHDDGVLVEGKWAHRLLVNRGARIETLLWCPEIGADSPGAAALAPRCAEVAGQTYEISTSTLRRVSNRNAPDGLVSLVRLPDWDPATVCPSKPALVLVVDGVNYAGNLGNLIRTADGSGAAAVLVTNGGVNRTHPLVFTASRGALLTLPLLEFSDVDDATRWLSERGFVCLLADPDADQSYEELRNAVESMAVVVGSEGRGLAPEWSQVPHRAVSIPLYGSVDSLNVGTAAAILLFEAARQRGGTTA